MDGKDRLDQKSTGNADVIKDFPSFITVNRMYWRRDFELISICADQPANQANALPYTILMEPGGKIVYAGQGPIDPAKVKRMIVNDRLIGRYY